MVAALSQECLQKHGRQAAEGQCQRAAGTQPVWQEVVVAEAGAMYN
jgi:hypothetical protein